jgi:hypothetical protein
MKKTYNLPTNSLKIYVHVKKYHNLLTMKNTPVYIILFILFLGCETGQKDLKEDLFIGKWTWSCEKVDGKYDNWVYRHPDYKDIIKCRGVETFVFHDDGKFDKYEFFCIPPGLNSNGDWKFDGEKLFLYYNDSEPIVYDIIKLNEEILIIDKY